MRFYLNCWLLWALYLTFVLPMVSLCMVLSQCNYLATEILSLTWTIHENSLSPPRPSFQMGGCGQFHISLQVDECWLCYDSIQHYVIKLLQSTLLWLMPLLLLLLLLLLFTLFVCFLIICCLLLLSRQWLLEHNVWVFSTAVLLVQTPKQRIPTISRNCVVFHFVTANHNASVDNEVQCLPYPWKSYYNDQGCSCF